MATTITIRQGDAVRYGETTFRVLAVWQGRLTLLTSGSYRDGQPYGTIEVAADQCKLRR
jgi:hypothetical protein